MSKIQPKKLAITSVLATVLVLSSMGMAYAQEFQIGSPLPPKGHGIEIGDVFHPVNLLQLAFAFVLGGIGWAILGWQKHRRQEGTPFSYKRLGKTSLVGVGVGIFSLAVIIYTDSSIEHLYATTLHGFLQLTVWAFMVVTTSSVLAKKLFPDAFDKIDSAPDTSIPEELEFPVPPQKEDEQS